jgi:hypothetical protein
MVMLATKTMIASGHDDGDQSSTTPSMMVAVCAPRGV